MEDAQQDAQIALSAAQREGILFVQSFRHASTNERYKHAIKSVASGGLGMARNFQTVLLARTLANNLSVAEKSAAWEAFKVLHQTQYDRIQTALDVSSKPTA